MRGVAERLFCANMLRQFLWSGLTPNVAPALRGDLALHGVACVRRNPYAAIVAALSSFRERLIGDVALREFALFVRTQFLHRDLLAPNVAPALRSDFSFDGFTRIWRRPNAAVVAALRALRRIAIGDSGLGKLLNCISEPRQSQQ